MKSPAPSSRALSLLPAAALCLGGAALLLLLASGFGTRLGLWHFRTGFSILKGAAYGGVASAVVGIVALAVTQRRHDRRGMLLSLLAVVCAASAAALPLSWMVKAQQVPKIHDISTDLSSPPPFVATAPARGERAAYGGERIAALQRGAYPELKTLVLPLPQGEAFREALAAAHDMGWQVVAADPVAGTIEATDTTFWFGFKDDISVRVAAAGGTSLVDVRSASRVGLSDVGTNAERIRRYLRKVSQRVSR